MNDNVVNDDVVMAGNVNNNSHNNNNANQGKTIAVVDGAKILVEYQSCQKFVLYQARNKYAALDGTARIESIRKHLKNNYSTTYPNMIELYDRISMIVTQMIVCERLNSARTWMDDDKTQNAKFKTLNGRLRLWHGKGRNDRKVIRQAYESWMKSANRRNSYK